MDRKLRIYAAMIAAVIMPAAVCCGRSDEGRHVCADAGFSIWFPKGWRVQERSRGTRILAEVPDSGPVTVIKQNANVVVDEPADRVDLDEYVESRVRSLGNIRGIYCSARTEAYINGVAARRFTYRHGINDFGYRAVVYVVPREGRYYVITGISQDEEYPSLEPVFHEIARSIQFM